MSGPEVSRRGIFKGAAGAVAAAQTANEAKAYRQGPPRYHPTQSNWAGGTTADASRDIFHESLDPFHAAKHALVQRATQERELLEEQLDRKRESLGRMKSVSEAYKRWMWEVYRKESRAVNARWEAYVGGIWGYKS